MDEAQAQDVRVGDRVVLYLTPGEGGGYGTVRQILRLGTYYEITVGTGKSARPRSAHAHYWAGEEKVRWILGPEELLWRVR